MKIVGIGAGGHAKVILEILRQDPSLEVIGLLDRNQELWGRILLGLPILGGDSLLEEIFKKGISHAFLGVGTMGSTRLRQELYESAKKLGFHFVSAIHPSAIVSPSAQIGAGATIMAGVVINLAAHIGDDVIINTGAVVEHDCVVNDHAHVSTSAALAGGVTIGVGSHVGIGASILQGICVGRNAIIGAGAVVIEDVADDVTVVGNPARILKKASS